MWGVTMLDQLVCRIAFQEYRYEGRYTPPSLQGSIVYPGNFGAFNWGGVAVDPVRQLIIATPNHFAFTVKLIPRKQYQNAGSSILRRAGRKIFWRSQQRSEAMGGGEAAVVAEVVLTRGELAGAAPDNIICRAVQEACPDLMGTFRNDSRLKRARTGR